MNRPAFARLFAALILACLLSPTAALAFGDGKKFFKEGMKHEIAKEWDKAAEAFAKAVADNPRNPEYQLHLQRSLFEASQMYMKKGRTAADEKDYAGAYTFFRKAYAFDPVNELAKSEMARMVRLQEEVLKGGETDNKTTGDAKFVQTGLNARPLDDVKIPQKFEKLRDVPFPGGVDLQFIVKELAKDLDLNVIFESESFRSPRRISIELKNVTAARALDYIFLQENLFFQRVGPRTILVANNQRRTNYQQLVLRTFYLANANPKDVKTIIQTAIPAQPGRTQTIVVEDASTNSLTIRDTAENIALFEKLIGSLDKDRAEVVMDVAIYEVSKSDLLKFGNQIGSEAQLSNLGGTTSGAVDFTRGGNLFGTLGRAATAALPTVMAAGLNIPTASLVAFQSKGNTRLLASTQIHAFNNEDSSARIGQRVPVRTAQFVTSGTTSNNGVVSDVINYEQVGLTLKFKPIVFPNHDVQVAMDIESKDVVAGGTDNNPVFSERKIVGTARVQNNKTLLLASVAQDVESRGRQGLPILGLIPVLGRLFAAPTRDNRQVDIVIAVTPKVIRAPAILPDDMIERPTGSLATPTNGSLEAMIIQEEREEQYAMNRRLPTNTAVQLPDQPNAPEYVRDAKPDATATATNASAEKPAEPSAATTAPPLNLQPIDTSAKTLEIKQASDTSVAATNPEPKQTLTVEANVEQKTTSAGTAELSLPSFFKEMKRGEKAMIPVMVKSPAAFRAAVVGLKFDPAQVAVRSVTYGDVFGETFANTTANPFLNQNGTMFVNLSLEKGVAPGSFGILAYIEVEALTDGKPSIQLAKEGMNFQSADGKNFPVKF